MINMRIHSLNIISNKKRNTIKLSLRMMVTIQLYENDIFALSRIFILQEKKKFLFIGSCLTDISPRVYWINFCSSQSWEQHR